MLVFWGLGLFFVLGRFACGSCFGWVFDCWFVSLCSYFYCLGLLVGCCSRWLVIAVCLLFGLLLESFPFCLCACDCCLCFIVLFSFVDLPLGCLLDFCYVINMMHRFISWFAVVGRWLWLVMF